MIGSQPIHAWLAEAVARGASDLHLVAGYPPMLRLHGELVPLAEPVLDDAILREQCASLCSVEEFARLLAEKNLDFAFEAVDGATAQRFRANYFLSGQSLGACFRIIPTEIPALDWAGFPWEVAERLTSFRDGLVLVTGVTGAGKSTTLAMLIQQLIDRGGYRILTIEDPIEYRFPKTATAVVTQREVGQDVHCFADGLKYGLRQDPDVILVGEIRDRETGQMALSAAETGHLVYSTMHTRDARGAISRYADLFPQHVQVEIRSQLALSLRAVVSQHLLPSATPGDRRVLAIEVLYNNSAIASAIRTGKIEMIANNIVTGRGEGMITLEDSLKRLVLAGKITSTTADRFKQ